VNLAANLHPPLSEYDLLGVLNAHYPCEVQKCMISANLKSNQEALTLLGKLQAVDEERKVLLCHKLNVFVPAGMLISGLYFLSLVTRRELILQS
jgi:hypothetical protein